MMASYSLRVPSQWAGRLDSRQMQTFLESYFQRACPLPPDPGAGPLQLTLSLPARAVESFSSGLGESVAGSLRRLAAFNLPLGSPYESAGAEFDLSGVYGAGTPGGASAEPRNSAAVPSGASKDGFWDSEMKVMLVIVVVSAFLILLIVKFGKRAATQPQAPRPAFEPWTPVES
jgi:hypothetical protein